METYLIAFVILGGSVGVMEVFGVWLIRFGNKTSQASWSFVGKAICVITSLLFVVGIVGISMARLR
jgi:hypothetical protein